MFFYIVTSKSEPNWDSVVTEKRLLALEKQYIKEEVDHRSRSFKAILDLGLSMPSAEADLVGRWFDARTRKSTTKAGVFDGAYYFDSEFWRVCVPLMYGSVSLNPYEQLEEMPESTVARLAESNEKDFLTFFGDCFDYGIGISNLGRSRETNFHEKLFRGGNEELKSASAGLLMRPNPNGRAMLHARNACEIFMKSILAEKASLDEQGAKKLNHNLLSAYEHVEAIFPNMERRSLRVVLSAFPTIDARYEGSSFDRRALADAFYAAQFLGATIVRERNGQSIQFDKVSPNSSES